MERTDWLDGGLDSAAARFLMMTAITHHEFSSPTWGEHEVRKLHAELAELDRLAAQAVVDHAGSGPQRRRVNVRLTTLTKPRESAVEVPGSRHGPFGRKELLNFRTDRGAADGPRFTPGLVKKSGTAASRHHLGPVVNPLRWEA